MAEPIVFIASIAPLQTAISIASDGGARVKLDIPESELDEIMALMRMRGKRLIVTVRIQEDLTGFDDEATKSAEGSPAIVDKRRAANRRD